MNPEEEFETKIGCFLLCIVLIGVIAFVFKQVWIIPVALIVWGLHTDIKYIKNREKENSLNYEIELSPYNIKLYRERAELNLKNKKYNEAIQDYTRIIEFNSSNPAENYACRAYAYYLAGENQLAIKDYNEAIAYQPQCSAWYSYRSLAYKNCGSESAYKEAIIDLNTAYELMYAKEPKIYNIESKNFRFGPSDLHFERGMLYSLINRPYCAVEELKLVPEKHKYIDIAKQEIEKCSVAFQSVKQIKQQKETDYWLNLDGWEFEKAIADVFNKMGYSTNVTKGSGDGGVDIIIEQSGYRAIVQCKHYSYPVQPEPVRALWGCKDEFNANEVILVATNGVTQAGQEFIDKRVQYKLYTLNDILELMAQVENKTGDFITEFRWYSKQPPQNKHCLDINLPLKINTDLAGNNVEIEYFIWETYKQDNYKLVSKKISIDIPNDYETKRKLIYSQKGNIDGDNIGSLYINLVDELNTQVESSDVDYATGLPKELKKFNWGAFLLPAIWLIGNKCSSVLGVLIAAGFVFNLLYKAGLDEIWGLIAYIGVSIFLGIKGNELAWKNNKYEDIEEFNIIQHRWVAGIIILIILTLLILSGIS